MQGCTGRGQGYAPEQGGKVRGPRAAGNLVKLIYPADCDLPGTCLRGSPADTAALSLGPPRCHHLPSNPWDRA